MSTFRDDKKLYMLTELVQGGELFSVLSRHDKIKPVAAKFYGACVLSALEHLHLGTTVCCTPWCRGGGALLVPLLPARPIHLAEPHPGFGATCARVRS
jgi:hypothetical protein